MGKRKEKENLIQILFAENCVTFNAKLFNWKYPMEENEVKYKISYRYSYCIIIIIFSL